MLGKRQHVSQLPLPRLLSVCLIAGNYVLQQLVCETSYTPYYYGSEKATFEQDFLIQQEMQIVPIEVKAETNVHSQSLKAFCEKFNPPRALRFSLLPYRNQGWMENIPLYGGCFL